MGAVIYAIRTCGLLLIISSVINSQSVSEKPWIVSFSVDGKSCDENCKYTLKVRGSEYLGHLSWRLTSESGVRGGPCSNIYPSYELREIVTTQWYTLLNVTVPFSDENIYFCLLYSKGNNPFGGVWYHQGADLYLNPKKDEVSHIKGEEELKTTESGVPVDQETTQNSVTENNVGTQMGSLQEPVKQWADLTHDTDVNYLPGASRPAREKSLYIEVYHKNGYVPLNNIIESNQVFNNDYKLDNNKFNKGTNFIRDKRDISNLITTENNDIINKGNINNDIIKNDNDRNILTNLRSEPLIIEGLKVELSNKDPRINDDGVPSVLAESKITIRLFGQGMTERTVIALTYDEMLAGDDCKFLEKGEFLVTPESVKSYTALFDITAPSPTEYGGKLYVCAKNLLPGHDVKTDKQKYIHQGTENFKALYIHTPLLPLWLAISLIFICLGFSALFSGLNLGLMSLDKTELKIISNTGTEKEKKYAKAIMPVRDHGNFLLCSILLGNVAVNSTFTIILDGLTSGLFAVIISTIAIVLLGEITPQAICSRHGLMVGAKTILVTKTVMCITAPLGYPVSKLLDCFLGEEIGNVYNRERLKELVKLTTDVNDLDNDEVNIISGALELRKKKVSEVMTKLEDVFMLPITSVLDFETMSEIIKSGYSRIPVYEGSRNNIITVLFIKDLAFVDPDDNTPLRTLCQYYQNCCNFVFEDVTLDVMFRQFKDGHKGHMAFVHRINNEGEGDPFYETIGLVTLEDVIEEMIQAEIVDETDVFLDNRSKRLRNRPQNKLQDIAAFAERHENQRIHISPQLTLATFQFLNTSVEAFRPDTISENVLRRLLRQDVIHHIKLKAKDRKDPSTYVYQQGKAVDYFVLLLEGRVEVTVGRENLVFEAGPFTYFGVQALTQNVGVAESPTPSAVGSLQNLNMDSMLRHSFVPDYSVRAITEVFYLSVKRSLYLAAKRATLMEKGVVSKGASTEQFDTEVDKASIKERIIEMMQVKKNSEEKLDLISDDFDDYAMQRSILDEIINSIFRPGGKIIKFQSPTIGSDHYSRDLQQSIDANTDRWLPSVDEPSTSTRDNPFSIEARLDVMEELLESVDEDMSISGDNKTPSRQVSPNTQPVSCSPGTRAVFASPRTPGSRNGSLHRDSIEEQEKLIK